MAQATFFQNDGNISYTPGSAVTGGNVVVVGDTIGIALRDIAASTLGSLATQGIFDVVKVSGAITDRASVYWDADGDPVGGTAGSGAASTDATVGLYLGKAISAAGSSDATVRVLLSDARQGGVVFNPQAVAAAGSAQGDATAIASTTGFVHGTGADGTKGIILPAASAGKTVFIKNSDAANAVLKVYPATGDGINALSANAAISMAAKTSAVFVALDSTTWYTIPLLPS